MNTKTFLTLFVAAFLVLCGFLIVDSVMIDGSCSGSIPCTLLQKPAEDSQTNSIAAAPNEPEVRPDPATKLIFETDEPQSSTMILGAEDPSTENPDTGFRFQIQLSSKGAAIKRLIFSDGEGKGFNDRDHDDPMPLILLSPVPTAKGTEVLSMANAGFIMVDHGIQLPLDKENWNNLGIINLPDGSQQAVFDMVIYTKQDASAPKTPAIKVTKTYTVTPGKYLVKCDIKVDNLTGEKQKTRFSMFGPAGISIEDLSYDMRKIVGGFKNPKDQITSERIAISKFNKKMLFEQMDISMPGDKFLWLATVNKYFAGIVIPVPRQGQQYSQWVTNQKALFYNPDGQKNTGDENIASSWQTTSETLDAKASREYNFEVYIGPKDKDILEGSDYYKSLGLIQVIDFMPCFCCPAAIIRPLAFGILTLMEWIHMVIPNYGLVIIILVFLIRLIIHPITKKSQISMSKMSKLGPLAEEIKKKYANNKAEMQKKMMELYREQGASPVMGMLPMFIQMPVWIALYSAINASMSLRGAEFLPFWITDLSAPDALFRFTPITIPWVNWHLSSFNLLPILMGIAFYLQQKLMPKTPTASTNPQMAQQQKMMMIMMPILFPLMLYNRPSGLNLYIMASTFAGVIEQYVIRKHIREKEEAEKQGLVAVTKKTGGKTKKKKPKPFFKTRV